MRFSKGKVLTQRRTRENAFRSKTVAYVITRVYELKEDDLSLLEVGNSGLYPMISQLCIEDCGYYKHFNPEVCNSIPSASQTL